MISGIDDKIKEGYAEYSLPDFGLQFLDESTLEYIQSIQKNKNNIALVVSKFVTNKKRSHYRVILSIIEILLKSSENNNVYLFIVGDYDRKSFLFKAPDTKWKSSLVFLDALNQTFSPIDLLRLNIITSEEKNFDESYTWLLKKFQQLSIGTLIMSRDVMEVPYLDAILCFHYNIIDMIFNIYNNFSNYSSGVISHIKSKRSLEGRTYYKFTMNLILNNDEKVFFLKKYAITRYQNGENKNDDTRLVSAVVGGRVLESLKEVSSEQLSKFLALITKYNCTWHIINGNDLDGFKGVHETLDRLIESGRFTVSKPLDDFQKTINDFDIYIQPLRNPGGGGAAGVNAVIAGLPVVLFNDADCEALVARIPKEIGFESGLIFLEKLIQEKEFRQLIARFNYENLKYRVQNHQTLNINSFINNMFEKELNCKPEL